MLKKTMLLLLLISCLPPPAWSREEAVAIRDMTGRDVPFDLVLIDETGGRVAVGDLLGVPAMLVPVYYSCEHLCPQVLARLADALPLLPAPGEAWTVLTVSIDGRDTPQAAAAARRNYLAAAGPGFPASSWRFLTADEATIGRLREAIGLRYIRRPDGFWHPEVLVFLGPGGRIAGYLPPGRESSGLTRPLPFVPAELAMRLEAARDGKVIPSAGSASPVVCFPHERVIELEFFGLLRRFAWVNLAAVAGLFLALAAAGLGRRGARG